MADVTDVIRYILMMKKRFADISNRKKFIAGSILFAAGFILMYISRISRAFAQWYSVHIYPVWVNVTGRLMGFFAFSVSEVLLYTLLLLAALTFLRLAVKVVKKHAVKKDFLTWGCGLYVLTGALFFLYVLNCGINYHRESFSESSGIKMESYTAEELKSVCLWLTEEVNSLSAGVIRDEEGVMRLGEGSMEAGKDTQGMEGRKGGGQAAAGPLRKKAVRAMQRLGREYPELSGFYPNPKGLLCPWILSVQQLTGIYSPFTVEANYNSGIVDYNIPFTMCHELSHLRGFMQEEEANFIAFLASSGSDDMHFQYSGYLMGWKYCMNVLYKADYDAWEEVRAQLSGNIEADLAANRDFWDQYDGRIAEAANKVNDTYLKANDQSEGVESYSKMVDLIVAYRAKERAGVSK